MFVTNLLFQLALACCGFARQIRQQVIVDNVFGRGVSYQGFYYDNFEAFLGIRYAETTGGSNRFKAPIPFQPQSNTVNDAVDPGRPCLQRQFNGTISADCLKLNIWRPKGTTAEAKLPVMVWIHGGGFVEGGKDSSATFPGGLINDSIANGQPIIHASMNYRLGVFGFAQSKYLKDTGNENVGLRDQRLALEWIHNNVAAFGGDPDRIAIHGQSSGAVAVAMQVLAYGGSKSAPFRAAICQSQGPEPGTTGNYTRNAQAAILAYTGCDRFDYDSKEAIDCLRNIYGLDLRDAQNGTACQDTCEGESPKAGSEGNVSSAQETPPCRVCLDGNLGDEWLPVVDGDFVPDVPSQLIAQGRMADVALILGWTAQDGVPFATGNNITAQEFMRHYLPALEPPTVDKVLELYPASDFRPSYRPNGTISLSVEDYRAAQVMRDVAFTCSAVDFAQGLSRIQSAGNQVFLYEFNQTIFTPNLENDGRFGWGVIHSSDIAYVFDNLDIYLKPDSRLKKVNITEVDRSLAHQVSGAWSSFATSLKPSIEGKETLQGWMPAQFADGNLGTYVIGGSSQGPSEEGSSARESVLKERLLERCKFWNQVEVVAQMQY
ncbi:unnamed protein product [Cercospora beticola]|nr:unnamed protein product [Cercospora beticola]